MPSDAETLTLQAFLNCYIRELPAGIEWTGQRGSSAASTVRVPLGGATLAVPCLYRSTTGHHRFALPARLEDAEGTRTLPGALDALRLLVDAVGARHGDAAGMEDLLRRTLSSMDVTERILAARADDLVKLVADEVAFLDAEQGLLAGHVIHPCPKSRDGMTGAEERRYAPEFASGFALHWFAADASIVDQGSAEGLPAAADWVETALGADLSGLRAGLPEDRDLVLLPVHPWQARSLLLGDDIRALIAAGDLFDLGEAGGDWFATSSVRTLYRPDMPFMLKLSLGVAITNSVRVNLGKELLRGQDMARFVASPLWQGLKADRPDFELIPDPAFLSIRHDDRLIDGCSVSIRANPFSGDAAGRNVTLLASLLEDLPGRGSRIGALVRRRAAAEGRPVATVAKDWFGRLMDCLLRPIVSLYLRHGLALEAHQQNLLVEISGGYPVRGFYRDNQGFFHHDRGHEALAAALPGLGEASQSVIGEAVVDERVVYYLVINAVFGVIGAMGRAGVADEAVLLDMLAGELAALERAEAGTSNVVRVALAPAFLCKANLLTRLARMDELVGPPETQSVYVTVRNPMTADARADAADSAAENAGIYADA